MKENNKAENYYFSDWNETIDFDFFGTDLEKVYQKLVKAFIRTDIGSTKDFNELVSLDNKIKSLKNEISMLENKIKNEKQFNRKVDINKILLDKKQQLKETEKDMR